VRVNFIYYNYILPNLTTLDLLANVECASSLTAASL